MKKKGENVKKHCIYITKMKLRVKRASLTLKRSHERVSASPPQKKRSVNISLLYKIKSFRWLFQELKRLIKQRNGKKNVN
jgi:hypothetical protein